MFVRAIKLARPLRTLQFKQILKVIPKPILTTQKRHLTDTGVAIGLGIIWGTSVSLWRLIIYEPYTVPTGMYTVKKRLGRYIPNTSNYQKVAFKQPQLVDTNPKTTIKNIKVNTKDGNYKVNITVISNEPFPLDKNFNNYMKCMEQNINYHEKVFMEDIILNDISESQLEHLIKIIKNRYLEYGINTKITINTMIKIQNAFPIL